MNIFYLLEVKWKKNFVLRKLIIGFFVYGGSYSNWDFYFVIDGFV